jgi:hypothetical protein
MLHDVLAVFYGLPIPQSGLWEPLVALVRDRFAVFPRLLQLVHQLLIGTDLQICNHALYPLRVHLNPDNLAFLPRLLQEVV